MVISHCSSLLHKLFTSKTPIGSFTKPSPFKKTLPVAPSSHPHLFHSLRLVLSTSPEKPISRFQMLALKNNGSVRNTVRNNNGSPKNISNGFSSVSHANIPRPDSQVRLEIHEVNGLALVPIKLRQKILIEKEKKPREKMEEVGIDSNLSRPGQYNHLICPMLCGPVFEQNVVERQYKRKIVVDMDLIVFRHIACQCGTSFDLLLSIFILPFGLQAFADEKSTYGKMSQFPKVKHIRKITYKTEKYIGKITEESLELERPCGELLLYFAARMISRETLQRNSVMQRRCNDQIVIAFPYRRNGVLVSCKYRDINKNFWQEKDTGKIFYGLDDIKDESDVIIVEGEIDKLSLEEAGFQNCVSVPDGAPPLVFREELPSEEQDTEYQYLWNCKEYLEKASRIILATDGDPPGQALAEELACRLGKDRCWRVRWPKKNKVGYFKDANEVLMYVGPGLLKEVIENAELYPIQGLFSFRDYFDEIDAYYHGTLGFEFGPPTGWRSLDQLHNERARDYYDGTTKEQIKKKQKFVSGRNSKKCQSKP